MIEGPRYFGIAITEGPLTYHFDDRRRREEKSFTIHLIQTKKLTLGKISPTVEMTKGRAGEMTRRLGYRNDQRKCRVTEAKRNG